MTGSWTSLARGSSLMAAWTMFDTPSASTRSDVMLSLTLGGLPGPGGVKSGPTAIATCTDPAVSELSQLYTQNCLSCTLG
jgi:hypothetical protein